MTRVSEHQADGGAAPHHIEQQPSEPSHNAATTAFRSHSSSHTEDPVRSRNVSTQRSVDLEHGDYDHGNDPYQLLAKLKSTDEIRNIRKSISHKPTIGSLAPGKTASKARKIQKYYENQNENIGRLLKPVSEHVREAKSENEANQLQFKIAVNGSFAVKVVLAALQLYAAISSGSLSIYTTMADALFDPLSNLTLILSARAVKSVDPRKFPSGKARIETAGNIVFCFLMCSVSFILIVLSARDLATGSQEATTKLHLPAVINVAISFVANGILFLYTWSLRNKYSQMRILWEDDRNDLFINGFGLMTSVGGSKLKWWIDPMGAIILSCIICVLWLKVAYSEFQLLIGVSADTNMLQLLTYVCKYLIYIHLHLHPQPTNA